MPAVLDGSRLILKNFLFLTDFSEPSEAAIPFVLAMAREYEVKVHTLHVLTPVALAYASPESAAATIEGLEEGAQVEMQRLDSQLTGVTHENILVRDQSVWPAVQRLLDERHIDLVILGTHGRTGAVKLLLASVAEEIFRRARVPVLTIGTRGAKRNSQRRQVPSCAVRNRFHARSTSRCAICRVACRGKSGAPIVAPRDARSIG